MQIIRAGRLRMQTKQRSMQYAMFMGCRELSKLEASKAIIESDSFSDI